MKVEGDSVGTFSKLFFFLVDAAASRALWGIGYRLSP